MTKTTDEQKLYDKMLENNHGDLVLPPQSFSIMKGKIIEYNDDEKSLCTKIPILNEWLNPYKTMQGGFINAAIDNAIGPLSLLVAPANMTRTMETKYLKAITMDVEYIYIYASLVEQRKKRLTFEVSVEDKNAQVYCQAKVVNFIL
ncbi:PaaI family thioesterase [Sulfurimonas sp.]|uniref:PaaI family thioesterase n=1 Tax=Sulfurimonas sp. TaxID=2022749 RepID=UPI003D0D3737